MADEENGFDMDLYLKEKFPEQEDTGLNYNHPQSAGEQIRALKESAAKKNIGIAETFRRLKSGRKFE